MLYVGLVTADNICTATFYAYVYCILVEINMWGVRENDGHRVDFPSSLKGKTLTKNQHEINIESNMELTSDFNIK